MGRLMSSLLGLGIFAGCFVLGQGSVRYSQGPVLREPIRDGRELVYVFVGASTCAYSAPARVGKAVEDSLATMRASALRAGYRPVAIGVSKDADRKRGVSYLDKIADWDEVSAGGSWLNSAVQHYALGELGGVGATPQVIVLERTVRRSGGMSRVDAERVLVRRVGLNEVESWARAGTPISTLLNN